MVSEPVLPWLRQLLSSIVDSQSSSSNFVLHTFSNPVAFKLDDDNYLPWKDQAEATIEGYRLMKYIRGEGIPKEYATEADQANGSISEEYLNWKQQDSLLRSWLLASMSKSFTTRMVGCKFSHQIWTRLEEFFASQTKAKVRQLKTQL